MVKAIIQETTTPSQMRINGDFFSLQQTILIKRDGLYTFMVSKEVALGDKVLRLSGPNLDQLSWEYVTDLEVVDEQSTIYRFDTEDGDVFFTENMLVHNYKLWV
jgi:intein/homing endonuclease